jgi:D-alanine transfer protein
MSKCPHLFSALVGLLLLAAALAGGQAYAQLVERRYIYSIAPVPFRQKYEGSALQREALRHPDLLVVYGSSEVDIADPFSLGRIFRLYPTGFAPFVVGGAGAESLIYLQRLAATEGDLRGKKVVISLSPQFFTAPAYWAQAYDANFSRLDAYETAFSTEFSFALKQRLARRILNYPNALNKDPLLKFALETLVDKSPWGAWLYYSLLPLGRLQILILELQDHWATLNFIGDQDHLDPVVPRRQAQLNWDTLLSHADQSYLQRSDSNPFGFENSQWQKYGSKWISSKNSLTDDKFLRALNQSRGWTDLALLLHVLKEAHARPLILSIPFPGRYMDYLGVSFAARQVYYQRLNEVVESYGMPLEDFEAYDEDDNFQIDPNGHLSSRGWIFYAEAIDAFYNDQLPQTFQ